MRAKQRDVRGNGTQRLYEYPPECWALFYDIRTLARERMGGLQTWRRRHNELVCWTRFIQSYLHKLPRWCTRFYHTELGSWNVFGSLRQFRLKLLSLEKQKPSRFSSLNAPFSLIILFCYPSEYCMQYWQWVSMRKTWIYVQRSDGAISRRRNDWLTDWLTNRNLNRIYTVTWKQS